MVDYLYLYQCIFGRPTLTELIAVPSTVHLKMKYYTTEGLVATLHGVTQEERSCFKASSKGLSSINVQPRMTTSDILPSSSEEVKPLLRVDTINLNGHFSKGSVSSKEQRERSLWSKTKV